MIEIIENDNIFEDKYLYPDLNYEYGYNRYNRYKGKNFYLARYPQNYDERCISSGKLQEIISNYKFSHTLNTRTGSSGSPICNENSDVIGVHNSGDEEHNINYGAFIGEIINYLKNQKTKKEEYNKEELIRDESKNKINIIHNEIDSDLIEKKNSKWWIKNVKWKGNN